MQEGHSQMFNSIVSVPTGAPFTHQIPNPICTVTTLTYVYRRWLAWVARLLLTSFRLAPFIAWWSLAPG